MSAGLPRLRDACPTEAIAVTGGLPAGHGPLSLLPRVLEGMPEKAIAFTREYRMAAAEREDLQVADHTGRIAAALSAGGQLFGRSLQLRQVSAGGCNACEADTNVLNTIAWDLGRFGIQFVASPPPRRRAFWSPARVTENMRLALERPIEAYPLPKMVIAVGACAIAGGPYRGHPEVTTAWRASFPSISSSPAARRTRSPFSTVYCDCSTGSQRDGKPPSSVATGQLAAL